MNTDSPSKGERVAPMPLELSATERSRFFADSMVSPKVSWDDLPRAMRMALDDLATGLLDVSGRRVIITGYASSGKTFLLEQFVHHLGHYMDRTSHGPLHIIDLNEDDVSPLNGARGMKEYAHELCEELNAAPQNICFRVETPELALYLNNAIPEFRVILETHVGVYEAIMEGASRSTGRAWFGWGLIDVNRIHVEQEELVCLLEKTMAVRLRKTHAIELSHAQLLNFVNVVRKRLPEAVVKKRGRNVIIMPPGIWATVLGLLGNNLAFNSDESYQTATGAPSFVKMIDKTLEDCEGLVNPYLRAAEDERETSVEALGELITSELSELFSGAMSKGKAKEAKENEEVKPFVFKDVKNLGARLKEGIFGQDEAVDAIANGFVVPAAGLGDPAKPLRSLFLLGPTGTGKTQVALDLAKTLGEEPMHVLRIDMSEYQQEHEVAKLFGSPPGYVGHETGGFLTTGVRENPHSLIILDEIEKAHPKVWDAFLQVLDSGAMTDAQGNVVDFTQTVLVMTSNVGAAESSRRKVGFDLGNVAAATQERNLDKTRIMQTALKSVFRPEFLNRIDEIVVFQEITLDVAEAIVRREIGLVEKRMASRGYSFTPYGADVVTTIIKNADISRYGAREIQRIVGRLVASPAAILMVSGDTAKKLKLTVTDENIVVGAAERE